MAKKPKAPNPPHKAQAEPDDTPEKKYDAYGKPLSEFTRDETRAPRPE